MNNYKIGLVEGISLLLVIVLAHLLVNIPQTIINISGSASLLNIIYVSIIAILFSLIIIKLLKTFPNLDLIDISEYLGGKFFKKLIGFIIISYIMFFASILVRNVIESLKIIYYFNNSATFVALFIIIVPCIANILGSKAIIRCNMILTPIIIILIGFSIIAVSPSIVWQRIFPILGYGFNNTFGIIGITNLFAFNGLLLLMLLPPLLNDNKNFKKIGITAIIINGVLLFLLVGTLLLSFPYVLTIESISPIYLMIVHTQLTGFFQRPEAVFIFILVLFIISYLNIITMFGIRIFKKITDIKNEKSLSYAFSMLIFILAFIPAGITEIRYYENTVYKYLTLIITYGLCIFILIGANIKHKLLKKRG